MRFLRSLLPSILLLGASVVDAASSWKFEDATISVSGKVGSGSKDKLSIKAPLSKPVTLGASDTVKILLTATEDGKPKRPHQAFLLLTDQDTGLETTFPITMKETGKGKVDITQKDLPIQLLSSSKPLSATLLLASFGTAQGYSSQVFSLEIKTDPNTPLPKYEKPLRYGKLAEIHHIFRADPKSGPKIVSVIFVLAVLATVPVLLGTWAYLGANLSHLSKATSAAPVAHGLFFGSIVLMEGLFFLYYHSWNLFQVLPVGLAIGLVIFFTTFNAYGIETDFTNPTSG
ncbi:Dolichyl-diphosphooligosaccharide-glycosyltransferase subunit SWP1 [Hyphodiscus hymeniophilus]|uniref:Dolichyl-diphosphooligosaccharide-glycosyltransferase subunit SWP1 n=1 Tax=Hyphodiscus hymeniophilus TaxID=353542 RepID=A0A9P6VDQ8_9HELO|nr:Dolichyl-diphosphooligosaccharide-glycosyltransferase subunit SWP1 [Hyphodiscus hymeniophilus]